ACTRAGGRADHRRFFYSSHCQSHASMHEGLLGKQGKPARRMKRRRAVITGIGPITCIGTGMENFWTGILAEKSGITRISTFDTSMFNAHCGGEITAWSPEEFFPPHRFKPLDRY